MNGTEKLIPIKAFMSHELHERLRAERYQYGTTMTHTVVEAVRIYLDSKDLTRRQQQASA